MRFYKEEKDDVLSYLGTSENGLSSEEAKKRQEKYGKNKLKEAKKKPLILRFLSQLADPMTIILIVAAAVSGVIAFLPDANGHVEGARGLVDVFIILAVVLINAVLGVYQESKAERAIDALQKMSAATTKVLRDGEIKTIPSEELTIGDIILLEAGDAIGADARIIESASLKTEEAALTGESVPVSKFIDIINMRDGEAEVPLAERKNMLYTGSTVVYGRCRAVVTAIGMDTEMGKIANAISEAEDNKTPLQKKLAGLSKILTFVVLGISVLVFIINLLNSGGDFGFATTILPSFMTAISLAVAAIPEGLAAVVTVVLSIGVTNMSKKRAIIRKLTAVETLGCAEIICSDKTGTLTQNKMTVVDFFTEDEKRLATAMALASDAEMNESGEFTGEPTEVALVAYANKLSLPKPQLKSELPRVAEAPFDSDRKMMSTVHTVSGAYIQYTKGAPDVVIERCTHYIENGEAKPMSAEYKARILAANKDMASRALRVLAGAEKRYAEIPDTDDLAALESHLTFIGLVGMIDPVRPEVVGAIKQCREAGITPIMITGDHVDTARAIAEELGILTEGKEAITGAELSAMTDEEFAKRFKNISVYARVQPEHKTRIVTAWENAGYVTAMTGDGVNDAPSIKAADIGVGMGITGTDVTKNVADMVLSDDNFATIVGAVEEGRRIYDNIRKSIQFLLGSNMSEVISIFVATLLGFTVLEPVHLLWINLVTDCFPALALGMEKAEPGIMRRKPRDSKEGIFAGGMGFDIAYQGLLVSALTLASYFIGHRLNEGSWDITNSAHGVTMAFLTMSMAEIFHSLNMRSTRKSIFSLKTFNPTLYIAAGVSMIATTHVCEIPFIAGAFGFESVDIVEYLIAIALGATVIPAVEIVKLIQRLIAKAKEKRVAKRAA